MQQVPIIESTAQSTSEARGMWWGLSLDAWNNFIVAFGALSGVFVLLTGGATYIAFQLQKEEAEQASADLTSYKLKVADNVADAKRAGIVAGREAGDANFKAAQANERAANLENENLILRKDLAEIDLKYAPRSLDAEGTKILRDLKRKIAPICIISYGGAEADAFADQLFIAFEKVGLVRVQGNFVHRITSATLGDVRGVSVNLGTLVKTPEEAERDLLVVALREAHVRLSLTWGPRQYAAILPEGLPQPYSLSPDERVIIVGENPPPKE